MAIVDIFAAPPGTTHTGTGTSPDPYDHLHDALSALGEADPGSRLILKTGTYTLGSSWNSVVWGTGTAANPYRVEPETYTPDTTYGIPAGTSSVIWKPSSGNGINTGVSGPAYWKIRGILFDGTTCANGMFLSNYEANNWEVRNCQYKDHGANKINSGQDLRISAVDLANSGNTTTLRNMQFRYCHFVYGTQAADTTSPTRAVEHYMYIHNSGNMIEHNLFEWGSNHPQIGIQYFATNTTGNFINDNIVRFNIFKNMPATAKGQAACLISQRCNRNKFYGNLYLDCTGAAMDFRGGSGIVGACDDNEWTYNLVHNCGKGWRFFDSAFNRTVIKNNLINDTTTPSEGTATNSDISNNRTDSLDPVWVNEAGDDYRLTASSPSAITEGGTPLGSPEDDADFDGVPRDPVAPSIGAFQFGDPTPPEPPINVYPVGFATEVDVAVTLDSLSVIDANDPKVLTEVWLYANGNGTFTGVTPGAATSVENP